MGEALLISGDGQAGELNTSRYRVLTPAKYLQKAGHTIRLQKNPGISTTIGTQQVDVPKGIDFTQIPETVLIERNIFPEWVKLFRLSGAKRVIVTFDDHYGAIPGSAEASGWWKRNYQKLLKALELADLVIVPSKLLVETYKPYCRRIEYVPNFIDDDDWVSQASVERLKRIGWGGSGEHVESWHQSKMLKDLKRILDENPDWELFLVGRAIPSAGEFFPKGMSIKWSDWMPYSKWVEVQRTFSIGIAPLHGEYDRYRSNLKLVEYGLADVPWIASWSDPYTSTHVRGGVLTKDANWYEALNLMVKDEKARQTLAKAGREWSEGFLMSRNISTYESVLWP